MTGLPTVLVELELAGVWTDITGRTLLAVGISFAHGRADEFSQPQPGRASLTLDNVDGRFTAGYPSSIYYPNLRVGCRLRISYTWAATLYRRYLGYVDEWPTEWPGSASYSKVPITATDRFAPLARGRKLRGMLQEEVLQSSPKGMWPLGDDAGSTAASDISGLVGPLTLRRAGLVGTYEFGSGTGPGGDGLTALVLTPTTAQGYYLGAVVTGIGESQSMQVWFNTSRAGEPQGLMFLRGPVAYLACSMSTTGQILVTSYPHPLPVLTSPRAYNDGLTHQVTVTRARAGDLFTTKLFVDGVLVASNAATLAGYAVYTPTAVYVGGMYPANLWPPFAGTLSNAAIFNGALSPAAVLAQYQAGALGGYGELTGARIARWARYLGIATADLNVDAGTSQMGVQPSDGADGLTLMQGAAAVENGVLFVAGDGRLRMRGRGVRYNAAAAFTLTAEDCHPSLRPVVDDFGMVNEAAYTRTGGATMLRRNAASITANGTYADQQTLATATDDDAGNHADWRVANYSTAVPRLAGISIDLLTQPSAATVTAAVAADVSDKFTVTALPTQAPASSMSLFIEGVAETLSAQAWDLALTVSPGQVGSAVLKLDDPTYGVLDTYQLAL